MLLFFSASRPIIGMNMNIGQPSHGRAAPVSGARLAVRRAKFRDIRLLAVTSHHSYSVQGGLDYSYSYSVQGGLDHAPVSRLNCIMKVVFNDCQASNQCARR